MLDERLVPKQKCHNRELPRGHATRLDEENVWDRWADRVSRKQERAQSKAQG